MDNLKHELNKAFLGFSHSVKDGNKISVNYKWNISHPDVSGIRISLHGTNSLNGYAIEPHEIAVLGPTSQRVISRGFPYDGRFSMHFDALDNSGNVLIADFKAPEEVRLDNPERRPFVAYSLSPAKRGWTQLTVTTNCPERCGGSLWAFYSGHYQQIPVAVAGDNVLYLPAHAKDIKLFLDGSSCPDIPQPQKK